MSESRRPEEKKQISQSDNPQSAPAKQISSTDLFCGESEVGIQHEGELYRLRLTRNGKLILHK